MALSHDAKQIGTKETASGIAGDDLDLVIETAWPGRMPPGERDIWNRLPPSRKRQAALRLVAIAGRYPEHGAPARFPTAALAAKAAGVATPTFYAIAKRWKSDPTLASLGIYLPSPSRDGSDGPPRAALRDRVRDLLIEDPDRSVDDVLDALDGEPRPSVTTVGRLIQEVRRSLPKEGAMGQRLVFDSAGLDLLDDGERPTRLRLCAVIDEGTGLVLGWDTAPEDSIMLGYRFAARHAAFGYKSRFRDFAPDLIPGGLHDLDFSNGAPLAGPPDHFIMRLPPEQVFQATDFDVPQYDVQLEMDRRLGRRVVATLGERVAGIWMGSGFRPGMRSYRTGRDALLPLANPGLQYEIGSAIAKSNNEKLRLIRGRKVPECRDGLVAQFETFFRNLVANMPPVARPHVASPLG